MCTVWADTQKGAPVMHICEPKSKKKHVLCSQWEAKMRKCGHQLCKCEFSWSNVHTMCAQIAPKDMCTGSAKCPQISEQSVSEREEAWIITIPRWRPINSIQSFRCCAEKLCSFFTAMLTAHGDIIVDILQSCHHPWQMSCKKTEAIDKKLSMHEQPAARESYDAAPEFDDCVELRGAIIAIFTISACSMFY